VLYGACTTLAILRCLYMTLGNPGGRPKVLGEIQELARQHAPSAIAELARLALKAKSETARIAAIRELLDRGYGRSRQALEVAAPAGDALDLLRLMMEEIDVIERKRAYKRDWKPDLGPH